MTITAETGQRKRMKGNEGYILVTAFLMISTLEIFSLALFSRFQANVTATERNQNKIVAFNMAESGLDNAIVQLRSNSNYPGTSSTGGAYITLGSHGGYGVTVCPPNCSNGLTEPTISTVRLIQSTGYGPGNTTTARAYEARNILAYVELNNKPFQYGAFGESSLTLNGTPLVDSYDSSAGAYGGANIGTDGDIASDGTISLIGHPTVHGDQIQNPNIDCAPGTTNLQTSGALSLSGSTNYSLAAGTYRFSSISVSGNARITATGPVTIYVDGAVSIAGNGVTTSGNTPTNFILIATGSSAVAISGNSSFYGGVYAPSSTVSYSGNGDFYGSVIAGNYQQSGTYDLHFDVAMRNSSAAPCNAVDLLSWRETGTTAA